MRFFLLFSFLTTQLSFSQYIADSKYLEAPEKSIGFVDSCASFWLKVYDDQYGGFYTNVNKTGNIYNTNKHMITQTRNAYGMVRAYMLTGNSDYLEKASATLNFMYNYAWDKNYGGWFGLMDKEGNPSNVNENKTAFNQHYALLGIAAFYEATLDPQHKTWLDSGYQHLENKFWDNRKDYQGYYDYTKYDGSSPANKSFNATVDAITTHLLYLYLMTGEQQYLDKLSLIADQIDNHLINSMSAQKIGFAEKYNSDWDINESETLTIMGHVLKTSWCLGRLYQVSSKQQYLDNALLLFNHVIDEGGYDHDNGGPYKDFDRKTGNMMMWGISDTAKAWWQMEQAVTAGLINYSITNDPFYLQIADETTDFFMKYFVDHENGEVYADRDKYGNKIEQWGETKGNDWKAGYHSIELGYYLYLYGNLFYKKKPVTLFYNFTTESLERIVKLTPLAIPDSLLVISDVQHNGSSYNNFNGASREIILPAGESGEFMVTFERRKTTSIANSLIEVPDSPILSQNYPNPFNPQTTISFKLSSAQQVSLKVFDINGKEVATLVKGFKNAGEHSVRFNGDNLASGIYFYQLKSENNISKVFKMVLMK